MAWKLEGTYLETCSCEVVCPCTASLALGADYDRCRATLVFHITDGDVEGTDVGGLTVAAVADTPKVMTDGDWRLGVFIDAGASDEQAEKLRGVFSGQLGGPVEALGGLIRRKPGVDGAPVSGGEHGGRMEALGGLFGENLGIGGARMEVHADGVRHSVKIGGEVDFEVDDVVPFGVESGEPARLTGIFHPAGSEVTIAHATR